MVTHMRNRLTTSNLLSLMAVPCLRGPYRVPLAQFVMDWNQSEYPTELIASEPRYEGTDPMVMPAIAVVVHALAARDGLPVPAWVWQHRASTDIALFGHSMRSNMGRWVRGRSPEASSLHRVFFDAGFLQKGTDKQWEPRAT